MQLTTEEQERTAYAAGNTALADAFSRIIDLEQERLQLRQCIRDAAELIDQEKTDEHVAWHAGANKLLDNDE
jgi:hypothetical protein